MNIVTIKAKALLAADRLKDIRGSVLPTNAAEIIESCFTPDSANSNNLLEALQALKYCKDVMHTCIMPLSDKMPLVSKCIYDARKVLEKYPNLI